MSVIPSLAWQTTGTPDYISRQEVVNAFSTLAGDLSGVDLSGLIITSPNPRFSTIQMNPSGSITGGANYTCSSALGVSSVLMTYNRPYPTGINPSFMLGIRDNITGTNYSPLAVNGILAKGQIFANGISQFVNPTQGGYFDANSNAVPITNFNSLVNQVSLTNISSINGVPPSGSQTFTTLTGTTLNSSNVNANALGSISSINGLVKVAPFSASYNATASGVPNAPFTSLFTISVPFNIPPNSIVCVAVPVRISAFASGSPTIAYFDLGVRVGGSGGQVAYTTPVSLNTALSAGSASYLLSAQVLTPASPTNTIEVICSTNAGVAYTCQITNPVSPANRYSIFVPT